MCSFVAGGGHHVRFLHHRLNPVVLYQDSSEHARSVDPKRLFCAVHRPHPVVVVGGGGGGRDRLDEPQHVDVDAGQEANGPARRVLLHRVRLQRVVHVRDSHPVRRQPQQAGISSRTCQHYRLRCHSVFLPRLLAHIPQKGLNVSYRLHYSSRE